MREIKFRAWHNEQMSKPFTLGEGVCWPDGRVTTANKIGKVIQYIGIKDRNGIEIYEGDVVKIYDDEFDYTFVGEVKFGFRGTPTFEIYDKRGDTYCDEYLTLTNDDLVFEVIGNIYTNPELLN